MPIHPKNEDTKLTLTASQVAFNMVAVIEDNSATAKEFISYLVKEVNEQWKVEVVVEALQKIIDEGTDAVGISDSAMKARKAIELIQKF